jgi:hypothetical protein
MPKPNTATGTNKPSGTHGKKNDPHLSTTADQSKEGEGRGSQSDQRPEHQESISHQEKAHNIDSDRGETENRDAREEGAKKTETPASSRQEESRGSVNRKPDFRADQVFSQIKNDRTLPPNAKYLCLLLVTYMNEEGEASPIIAALADVTGLNRDTVSKHLKILVDEEWLTLEKLRDASGRLITVYKWARNTD